MTNKEKILNALCRSKYTLIYYNYIFGPSYKSTPVISRIFYNTLEEAQKELKQSNLDYKNLSFAIIRIKQKDITKVNPPYTQITQFSKG